MQMLIRLGRLGVGKGVGVRSQLPHVHHQANVGGPPEAIGKSSAALAE